MPIANHSSCYVILYALLGIRVMIQSGYSFWLGSHDLSWRGILKGDIMKLKQGIVKIENPAWLWVPKTDLDETPFCNFDNQDQIDEFVKQYTEADYDIDS